MTRANKTLKQMKHKIEKLVGRDKKLEELKKLQKNYSKAKSDYIEKRKKKKEKKL